MATEIGQEEHAAALQALLPRGPVWQGPVLARVCLGLAAPFSRLRARALALLVDAFPPTALQLLPDWEETVGLPDECTGDTPNLQQRRARVAARLTARGGQSVPYFVDVAAALGFAIEVEEFSPAAAGRLVAGGAVYGEAWASAWRIRAPATTVTSFRAGQSQAGDPLRTWGYGALECSLRRIRPAHTVLIFAYGN
ncbi:YmfQ family protein [Roseomonas sp. USHLN139]|uniref:YmfQ family protein n=1 Tax=Roseomonas sp. USHLN139 TaxID=3081298 RepID=UPI003B01A07D